MNIWIFNHHALTPDMNGGTRHYDFGKELVKRGHNVSIVASSFHHSEYREMKKYKGKPYIEENIDNLNFVWIKTPPYFGSGFGRVINMLSYAFKVLKIMPKINLDRPDIVIGSSVHLFAVLAAYKIAKRYKSLFIMEIRDLWPQTLIEAGMSKYHPFIIVLTILEKYLYKRADKVISNLPYAYDYIGQFISKDKFVWVSNGVNLSNIKYVEKIQDKKFIVTYTGSIGVFNNLQTLVNVAKKLKYSKDIYFKIVGNGDQKNKLKKFIIDNDLQNVSIVNPVPKYQISKILQKSDVLYFNLKNNAVFNYGISSNKIFDYMAAGRVIIFSANSRNNPIKDANAGYSMSADDENELERTILEIYNLTHQQRIEIGRRIRKYVEQNYSIESLVDKLENILKEGIKNFNA